MKVLYSARYHLDIGRHVFPTQKYDLVHARLMGAGAPPARGKKTLPLEIVEADAASWDQLALVHTAEYLGKMRTGTLSEEDSTHLELPWSPEMRDGFRTMVGGTIQAARLACGVSDDAQAAGPSVVVHLGGGLHHAFPNHGEGFCPFNDVAVAVRVLQSHGLERVAIIDLDVHQGNGTAFIFNPGGTPLAPSHGGSRGDPDQAVVDRRVFTFSMHQQHNYPMWKPRGLLDIGLPDGTHDDTFLDELKRALPIVMQSRPQCVFYLAGADPYEDDQLGGLRLTQEGLRERDRIVIEAVRATGAALVVVLAGGYARRVEDTVAIHVATVVEAAAARTGWGTGSRSA